MDVYFAGMMLGLAMITPIGPQNIFLINQGFTFGVPRVFVAVVAAGICDTVLISLGGAGTSAVLERIPGIKEFLLAAGVVFLTYLAVKSFRSSFRSRPEDFDQSTAPEMRWPRVVAQCASVTVLNPHAVLDVVGILGVAIAAQDPAHRPGSTAGAVSASWLWFTALALGASTLRRWLTPHRRVWIDRVSGALLLVFAALFAGELLRP
ncbi:LysE family transporter [Streptomyces sp. DG2A-72]|uniref:LysE/ArgO family amino acid transporter n=1 Tax=Streptomyces sp. DG2A-72 TaxID=3051386 RepID=UPI00265BA391|nr:LysE family transporter [Streptomyces sp. DG2A-72]MDO0936231.1 LysE family transporter [Streptomyces sp. DG2A-72]